MTPKEFGTKITGALLVGMGYELIVESNKHGDYRKYEKKYYDIENQEFRVSEITFSYGGILVVNMYGQDKGITFSTRFEVKPGGDIFAMEELSMLEGMVGIR